MRGHGALHGWVAKELSEQIWGYILEVELIEFGHGQDEGVATALFKDEHSSTSYSIFFYSMTLEVPINRQTLTLLPLNLSMIVTASTNWGTGHIRPCNSLKLS